MHVLIPDARLACEPSIARVALGPEADPALHGMAQALGALSGDAALHSRS